MDYLLSLNIRLFNRRIILFCDNQTIIDTIIGHILRTPYRHLITLIRQTLLKLPNIPELYWVKGHAQLYMVMKWQIC